MIVVTLLLVLLSATAGTCLNCSTDALGGFIVCRNVGWPSANDIANYTNVSITDCGQLQLNSDSLTFTKVVTLNVTFCDIQSIGEDAFSKMPFLKNLNLSHDNIKKLSPEMFVGANVTEVVDLSHNDILELPPHVFNAMQKLKWLDLSHCQLATLHDDSFDFLPSIEFIYLDSNSLASLPNGMLHHSQQLKELHVNKNKLMSMSKMFINPWLSCNTTMFYMSENPWNCDCSLLWLRTSSVPCVGLNDAVCVSPEEVKGQNLTGFQLDINKCDTCISGSCDSGSGRRVALAIIIPLLIVGLVGLVCYCFCRHRRNKANRPSHRYSAVYKETVESSGTPLHSAQHI